MRRISALWIEGRSSGSPYGGFGGGAGGNRGGKPGGRSRFVIHLGADAERETPASGRYELQAGERFFLQSAGGGGYGDPAKRDRASLARDIAEGYVSPASATRDYGYEE